MCCVVVLMQHTTNSNMMCAIISTKLKLKHERFFLFLGNAKINNLINNLKF